MIRTYEKDGVLYWTDDSPIVQDWHHGVSYEELHRVYGPWGKCECDDCDKARLNEKENDDDGD